MQMGSGEGSTMTNFIVRTVHINIVRMIKSGRLRCKGRVAIMEECRDYRRALENAKLNLQVP